MRVLIPSEGEDIISDIDESFSKTKFFILIDVDKDIWEVMENEFKHLDHPGDRVAKKAIELKVNKVIVHSIGPHAFDILTKNNIEVFYFEKGEIKVAINKLKKNELAQMFKPNKKHGKFFKED